MAADDGEAADVVNLFGTNGAGVVIESQQLEEHAELSPAEILNGLNTMRAVVYAEFYPEISGYAGTRTSPTHPIMNGVTSLGTQVHGLSVIVSLGHTEEKRNAIIESVKELVGEEHFSIDADCIYIQPDAVGKLIEAGVHFPGSKLFKAGSIHFANEADIRDYSVEMLNCNLVQRTYSKHPLVDQGKLILNTNETDIDIPLLVKTIMKVQDYDIIDLQKQLRGPDKGKYVIEDPVIIKTLIDAGLTYDTQKYSGITVAPSIDPFNGRPPTNPYVADETTRLGLHALVNDVTTGAKVTLIQTKDNLLHGIATDGQPTSMTGGAYIPVGSNMAAPNVIGPVAERGNPLLRVQNAGGPDHWQGRTDLWPVAETDPLERDSEFLQQPQYVGQFDDTLVAPAATIHGPAMAVTTELSYTDIDVLDKWKTDIKNCNITLNCIEGKDGVVREVLLIKPKSKGLFTNKTHAVEVPDMIGAFLKARNIEPTALEQVTAETKITSREAFKSKQVLDSYIVSEPEQVTALKDLLRGHVCDTASFASAWAAR